MTLAGRYAERSNEAADKAAFHHQRLEMARHMYQRTGDWVYLNHANLHMDLGRKEARKAMIFRNFAAILSRPDNDLLQDNAR